MWFKIHPAWLESESRELSSNGNYIERFQARDRFFVSSGEIVVRLRETTRHPVLFFYPDSTPYKPPKVFILRDLLSIDEVNAIAAGKKEGLSIIPERVRMIGNSRHQAEDGSLCFVERENLAEQGIECFTAKDVIKRVREWFAGNETGRFPKDSAEVELFFHFAKRARDQRLLIPDAFFYPEIVEGEFYFGLNSVFPDLAVSSFIGLLLLGQNSMGVSLPPRSYSSSRHLKILFSATEVNNPVELITKPGKTDELVAAGRLIKGKWWSLDREPMPFTNVKEMANYVGHGDEDLALQKIVGAFKEPLRLHEKRLYVALRFPGRRSQFDWIFIRLDRTENEAVGLINPTPAELSERACSYVLKAIYSEVFTEQEYHLRNSGRVARDMLAKQKATLVGCGALGSEIADCLAKAGVGEIGLVDNEELHAKNSVRHLLGLNRVMIPKVLGMSEHLVLHNPFVETEPFELDITNYNINRYCNTDSVAVSTIADDDVEGYLNEQAVLNNRTVFYVRALRGGKVARIFRVIPGKDPCKNCLALYSVNGDRQFIQIPEDATLPTIRNECNNPIRPASAADLKSIAAIAARLILNHLQNGPDPNNHWIWSTEDFQGLRRPTGTDVVLATSFFAPHPDCELCRHEDPVRVCLDKDTMHFMIAECKQSKDKETGGVLIGFRDRFGEIVVTRATGPGPGAKRRPDWFERDVGFCQSELEKAYKELDGRGLYVGEWHYHPAGSNSPSSRDLLSLSEIAELPNYMTDKPVMLIFSSDSALSATVHPPNRRFYFTTCAVLDSIETKTIS
jgi:integrative and conjugative element protein (TIGR02256 family)